MGAHPSKLTDQDVRWIRKTSEKRTLSQNAMARKFGVSLCHINDIVHNKRRRDVK